MCRIFRCEGVYLVDGRHDTELLAPLTYGETCLRHVHIAFQTNGPSYLEVGESIDLGLAQQTDELWSLEILYQFEGIHECGHVRELSEPMQSAVDVDDVVQLLQEPSVDHRKLVDLFYAVSLVKSSQLLFMMKH